MSELTDFNEAGYATAKTIIGPTSFAIGSGDPVDVVPAEARHDRESENTGFQKSSSLSLVASVTEFRVAYPLEVETYNGKHCTNGADLWKIDSISEGESFIMITLIGRDEVS